LYESEPVYQDGVQSTGNRTTPDVSLLADPVTGAWIADSYNLGVNNPFEVVGGTSLSAPAWAGLVALVNQGRAAAGLSALNSSSPTDTEQALYSLPQTDYNVITSGSNGYTANAGYNLVTGLGTPVANLLVSNLVAYQGPGTNYAGPTVGALKDATLTGTWSSGGGTTEVFSVLSAITVSRSELGHGQGPDAARALNAPVSETPAQSVVASQRVVAPVTTSATNLGLARGFSSQAGLVQALGAQTTFVALDQNSQSPATLAITPVSAGPGTHEAGWSATIAALSAPDNSGNPAGSTATACEALDRLYSARASSRLVSDAILDDLAADSALWPAVEGYGAITIPVLSADRVIGDPASGDPLPQIDRPLPPSDTAAGLVVLGLAAGLWARGTSATGARKRRSGALFSDRNHGPRSN
jgi:hypothetical protein